MKQLLRSFAALLLFLPAGFAQAQSTVPIGSADVLDPGDSLIMAVDTTTEVLPVGNPPWDFSTLQRDFVDSSIVYPPDSTPFASDFPTATHALFVTPLFVFQAKALTTLMDQGIAGEFDFNGNSTTQSVVFDEPIVNLRFNAPVGDTLRDTTRFEVLASGSDVGITQVDSIRFVRHIYRTNMWTGAGQLMLPDTTFGNAYHHYQRDLSRDSVFVKIPFAGWQAGVPGVVPAESFDTTFNHFWFTASQRTPVMSLNLDPQDSVSMAGARYYPVPAIQDTTSRSKLYSASGIKIFPNPSPGTFQLELDKPASSPAELELVGLDGRRVWQGKLRAGQQRLQVDVSGLAAGLYTFRLQSGSGQLLRRVLIR